jgi:protein SCO1/2
MIVRPAPVAMMVAALVAAGAGGLDAQQRRQYPVTGMVLRVDAPNSTLVVSHDAIAGLMPAMTMPFTVSDRRALAGIEPGAAVAFTLTLDERSARAEQIRIVRYESVEQDPVTARRLQMLRQITGTATKPIEVGQVVPDFTLTSQIRQPQSLSQLRGKVVAVNFIYTSCALPQFCLRIANHFGVLQRRFQAELGRDLALLTVTFDPGRDTPERLAEYASQWQANASTWRFLTGPSEDIRRVAGLFGVDFFPDEGLMSHSVRTAIIDRRGVLVASIEGNRYTATQLGDLVAATLERRP